MDPKEAARVAGRLYNMGCYEVSMGDTIGVGSPATVSAMFKVGMIAPATCYIRIPGQVQHWAACYKL